MHCCAGARRWASARVPRRSAWCPGCAAGRPRARAACARVVARRSASAAFRETLGGPRRPLRPRPAHVPQPGRSAAQCVAGGVHEGGASGWTAPRDRAAGRGGPQAVAARARPTMNHTRTRAGVARCGRVRVCGQMRVRVFACRSAPVRRCASVALVHHRNRHVDAADAPRARAGAEPCPGTRITSAIASVSPWSLAGGSSADAVRSRHDAYAKLVAPCRGHRAQRTQPADAHVDDGTRAAVGLDASSPPQRHRPGGPLCAQLARVPSRSQRVRRGSGRERRIVRLYCCRQCTYAQLAVSPRAPAAVLDSLHPALGESDWVARPPSCRRIRTGALSASQIRGESSLSAKSHILSHRNSRRSRSKSSDGGDDCVGRTRWSLHAIHAS